MIKSFLAASFILASVAFHPAHADTLTLQQGLNGFTGFTDTYIVMSTDSTPDQSIQLVVEGYHCSACIDERALIKIDLSGVPQNAVVGKAELQLFSPSQPRPGAGTVRACRIAKPWTAAEADWWNASKSLKWTVGGGDYDSKAAAALNYGTQLNVWHKLDVTQAVRDFIANPASNNGFMLMLDPSMLTVTYVSSDGIQERRPKLVVAYSGAGVLSSVRLKRTPGFSIESAASGIRFGFPRPGLYRVDVERLDGSMVMNDRVYGAAYGFAARGLPSGLYMAHAAGNQGGLGKEITVMH
jgi:hypothetical protein